MAKNTLGIERLANWKPNLLGNDKAGVEIDWEERLEGVEDGNWVISDKNDGGRVEVIEDGRGLSRELKVLPSIQVQQMSQDFTDLVQHQGIVEAEFYAPNMTFSEIMHFFKSEDVTSEKNVAKYTKLWEKTGGDPKKGWRYPGRSVEWLTTWHDELQFYIFDHVMSDTDDRGKWDRYLELQALFNKHKDINAKLIRQREVTHIDEVYQAYDQIILDGGEGLVAYKKDARYKNGRYTVKQGEAFKIKDSNRDYDGIIIGLKEGTMVKEGIEKTINNFGRSKTSQKKDDRIPSGMCSGFLVRMDDGTDRELTVSLNDYNHEERRALLANPSTYIGQKIKFTGMPPVSSRETSVPRHCHYTKGNLRS